MPVLKESVFVSTENQVPDQAGSRHCHPSPYNQPIKSEPRESVVTNPVTLASFFIASI